MSIPPRWLTSLADFFQYEINFAWTLPHVECYFDLEMPTNASIINNTAVTTSTMFQIVLPSAIFTNG